MGCQKNAKLFLTMFRCVVCGAPLRGSPSGGHLCSANSKHAFPVVGKGIKVFLPDAAGAVRLAGARLKACIYEIDQEIEDLAAALKTAPLENTRVRLTRLRRGKIDFKRELERLFIPWTAKPQASAADAVFDVKSFKFSFPFLGYGANVARDWAWGELESQQSWEFFSSSLPAGALGRDLLVVGAGAGRMTYDCARYHSETQVYALDLDPALLQIFEAVLEGPVPWTDFPLVPVNQNSVAVKLALSIPQRMQNTPQLIWGDARQIPFINESLDSVLLPWILDVVGESWVRVLAETNRVLKKGGRWLFWGPLGFSSQNSEERHTIEELEELCREAGFQIVISTHRRLPYLQSPHDTHNRAELIHLLVAEKVEAVGPELESLSLNVKRPDVDAPLAETPSRAEALDAARLRLRLLEALAPGARISDVAKKLSSEFGMEANELQAHIQVLVSKWI